MQAALEPNGANQVMNLTRGEGRTLREFANILKEFVPSLEVIEEEVDKDIPMRGSLDISKAQELIKYDPQHSLEKGVEKYVAFVRECMGELEVK